MSPFSPPKKAAFVIGISATLFQPVRSGSHLYTANLYTLRSGHQVKGLTDSRGSFPLGLPCPRLLCLYYSTSFGVCQEVFSTFFIPLGDDSAGISRKGEPVSTQSPMGAISFPLRWLLTASLLTPLLYHNSGDLSRGFLHFFWEGTLDYCSALAYGIPTLRWLYRVSPLDTIIIPHPTPKVNSAECTNSGKNIFCFLCDFLLDKMLAVCYNGKFRAHQPWARRWKSHPKMEWLSH